MDDQKLLEALRDETLPALPAARAALDAVKRGGQAPALAPVRELCHRVAGTGAVAGLPALSRVARIGEYVALLALDGEAQASPRLCSALAQVLDALEAGLAGETTERVRSPVSPPAAPAPDSGPGHLAVVSDEAVSSKLLSRVLEDAGFEVTKRKLAEAAQAAAVDAVVLDVPASDGALPALEAALSAALAARVPVLLTGKPGAEAVKALGQRASQVLEKPVAPEALEAAARTLVARRRMAVAARAKAPTAQLPAPASPGAQGRKGPALKVLVVDDSRVIRGVVREALAEAGLSSVEAEDGAEAVRLYDAEKPDAVISDVQMPGLDGAQLTRLLRERGEQEGGRRVPIVVLSALDDDASRRAALDAGADAYLVKSVIDGPALSQALKGAGLPID